MLSWCTKGHSIFDSADDCFFDIGMVMPMDERPPRATKVDELISILVVEPTALCIFYK